MFDYTFQTWRAILVVGGVGLAAFAGYQLFKPLPLNAQATAIQPYTVVLENTTNNPAKEPSRKLMMYHVMARRADGSTYDAVKEARDGFTTVDIRTPSYFVRSYPTAKVFSGVRAASRGPLDTGDQLTAASNCELRTDGQRPAGAGTASEPVQGYRVFRFFTDHPSRRVTHWRAPELGCAEVGQLMEFKDKDGNISDSSTQTAVSILPSADDALFTIPDDYEMLDFKAAFTKALTLRMGRTPPPVDDRMFGPIAARYESLRFDPRTAR